MRSLVLLVLAPMLANARACGSSEPPVVTPAPIAAVSVSANAAVLPSAKHGGTVVAIDDVQMELVVKGDGQVVAYPVQATPTAAATLTADAQVTVDVPVASGGTRPTVLVWSPVEARFVGQVRGGTVVTTRPADVNVTVVSHGRRRHHRVQHVVVAPAATVVVERPATTVVVERPAATVVVERPAATVVVQRPILDVRIGGGVVVDTDHHHDEHHGHHDNGRHLGHSRGGGHRGRH